MAIPFLDNLDLKKNQTLNRVLQILGTAPASPVLGQEYFDSTTNTPLFYNGTVWQNPFSRTFHTGTQLSATISDLTTTVQGYRLDQFAAPNVSVSLNSQKIINLLDPTGPQDAATKKYVDTVSQGYAPKGSANAATAAALPANTYSAGVLTASANGALVVDGYTVLANDIVLVKNEATQSNNGLYTVTATGGASAAYVLTRASNMNISSEFSGAYVVVDITSTVNSGAIFLCNQVSPTIGTTAITFTRINSPNTYTADGTTLTLTASTFSIATAYAGQASITTLGTISTGTWQGTPVALLYGGTGATTATGARTNLGATGKYAVTIGNGAATSFTITHNLNAQDCVVTVRDTASNTSAMTTVVFTDANNVTVSFASPPASNSYRVVVVG